MFREQMIRELTEHMLPFWQGLRDETYGGYYGWLDIDLHLDKQAEKGCILNSRIMWFFANAAMSLQDDSLLPYAKHSFEFLKAHCLDQEFGGVFWSLDYQGNVLDSTKHTYNQAFSIYALSSYFAATGDREALRLAYELFDIVESKCVDEYGYMEAFTREFLPESNEKLSENGVMAEKTMNTLLHVFEAYTELYRVDGDERVAGRLRYLLDLLAEKVYNPAQGRLEVFFDRQWNPIIDLYSYGHDIETAWLVDRGLGVLKDASYTAKLAPIVEAITSNIYDKAYVNHSIVLEAENGKVDTTRVWWVQAEAIVGFLNAYGKGGPEASKYLAAAEDIWEYCKEYLIDKRPGSEWFWQCDENGVPSTRPIVEPWKCPYHAGRMCFEVMRRI